MWSASWLPILDPNGTSSSYALKPFLHEKFRKNEKISRKNNKRICVHINSKYVQMIYKCFYLGIVFGIIQTIEIIQIIFAFTHKCIWNWRNGAATYL